MMYTAIQAGIDTRRLYRFEDEYFTSKRMRKIRSMRCLRQMAKRIMKNPPRIVANRGVYYNGRLLSYQSEDGVFLARNQREYITLVHELVHAMGYDFHDKAFVVKYFELLVKHFGMSKKDLISAARKYRLSI